PLPGSRTVDPPVKANSSAWPVSARSSPSATSDDPTADTHTRGPAVCLNQHRSATKSFLPKNNGPTTGERQLVVVSTPVCACPTVIGSTLKAGHWMKVPTNAIPVVSVKTGAGGVKVKVARLAVAR